MDENIQKGFEGEKFVHEIASKAYLSYWCYPNPKDEEGDKKEICDLLLYFNSILIIFFIKNYQFNNNYYRYFNKTIEKDLNKLPGAERKLLKSNRIIKIKNVDGRLEEIKPSDISKIHRVIIHLGKDVKFYPFKSHTKNGNYVHIFDKESFRNVISTLDTIKDIEHYLDKRETKFANKKVLILPAEENDFDKNAQKSIFEHWGINSDIFISGTESDLLAHYYNNNKSFFPNIDLEKYDGSLLQIDGEWEAFCRDYRVVNKHAADRISYFIDKFVDTEVLKNPTEQGVNLAKALLSFDRFDRRIISKQLYDFVENHNHIYNPRYFARRYGKVDNTTILFFFYCLSTPPQIVNHAIDVYIKGHLLLSPNMHQQIILIATTNEMKQFKFHYDNTPIPISKEEEKQLMEDINLLGFFKDGEELIYQEFEFPDK